MLRIKLAIHVLCGRPLIYNVVLTQGPGAINFVPDKNTNVIIARVQVINAKVGFDNAG